MKATTWMAAVALLIIPLPAPSLGAHIPARVGLGTRAGDFFDPASGFVAGSTSHTNSFTFTDGTVSATFDIKIEGFDSGGAPAALVPNNQAVGVGVLGVNDNRLDAGESIKVTYLALTAVYPPAVQGGSITYNLSSIKMAADFDFGTDTYTYAGPGAAAAMGDDTDHLQWDPDTPLSVGNMFTLTADSGAFRVLYVSHGVEYQVPEPASLAVSALALGGLGWRRRRR